MPVKKNSKKVKQTGGWWYEKSDPIFGASNRFIGDKIITPTNKFLKKTKLLSTIAGPVGSFLGGPGGAVAGAVASVGLQQLGYGNHARPSGKAPQYGAHIYRTHKTMTGRGSPFLLTNNSSFNSVKF
jgi:hypothetical protein